MTSEAPGLAVRREAATILLDVEGGRAHADALLGRLLSSADWSPSDRALVVRLVYGTLAWQRRLDWAIDRLTGDRRRNVEPAIRVLLRLGLYQLGFLDRVPAFAAVDTAVRLAGDHRGGRARGFVNAVLRRAGREGLPTPPNGSDADAIGVRLSHPTWLVEAWLEELGTERALAVLAANQEAGPVAAYVGAAPDTRAAAIAALEARGATFVPSRWSPDAVVLEPPVPPELVHRPGLPSFLSEASQLVAGLVDLPPDGRILDACAAPGGKTLVLADRIQPLDPGHPHHPGDPSRHPGDPSRHPGESRDPLAPTPSRTSSGRLISADVGLAGVRAARDRLNAAPSGTVSWTVADGERPPFPEHSFARVLLDAPCSGTGTLRSHPEIRWRLDPAAVAAHARRQSRLLESLSHLVEPGGVLVYATCSLLRAENDDVVDAFLEAHRDFLEDDVTPLLPEAARVLATDGRFRSRPDQGLDGFFAARLRRSG